MQVEVAIARDGNISQVTNVLFTTSEGTASGNCTFTEWAVKTFSVQFVYILLRTSACH